MRAMILAAGRGERLRPLTDRTPKPLIEVGGRSLIEWQVARLARAGLRELVINVSHLGERIEAALGDGSRLGVAIAWSREPVALETAGGIAAALPLLGEHAFAVVNADVWCDFDLRRLLAVGARLAAQAGAAAHLVLVPNPAHHPAGDFALASDGRVLVRPHDRLTFSGIGVYTPALFADIAPGARAALAPRLAALAPAGALSGERFDGCWIDVGTPERLALARAAAASVDVP